MMKEVPTLPCIVCAKKLKPAVDNELNQPNDGLAFCTYGHYGSTFFDPMDGSQLEINICDSCLKKRAAEGFVLEFKDAPRPRQIYQWPSVREEPKG